MNRPRIGLRGPPDTEYVNAALVGLPHHSQLQRVTCEENKFLLGVEKWAVRVIQGMYVNARSRVRVNGQYSEEFGVGVGVYQGSVLSPLLFILVLEALSR